jgi:hypothetical protein
MTETDPLIKALLGCESRLAAWLNESALNAALFRHDPMTAIRAANLGIDESLLCDLEEILTGITLKLKAG